ncbi:MAG: hypothetical protein M1587_11020 [Thaumarchaeota archaeon]|nr:hypothetical protein [Nitrososphaerota archaeon]MDG6906446.1 hypothetical protein [Nitrososphaerota archaeon]
MSSYDAEEERLKKLYDQARIQGDKKKKKEYKEKLAELNRRKKQEIRASRRDSELDDH